MSLEALAAQIAASSISSDAPTLIMSTELAKELLASSPAPKPGTNFLEVSPRNRAKIAPIVEHYRPMAHPFTACVRDNRKRFGPDTERVCAVVKDMIEGNTHWRKGKTKVSASVYKRKGKTVPVANQAAQQGHSTRPVSKRDGTGNLGGQKTGSGSGDFNSKHPRAPKGASNGGKFVSAQGGGSTTQVKTIQRKVGAKEDGQYGKETTAKVKSFQKRKGLQVDGVVGRQTAAALAGSKHADKVTPGALSTADRRELSGTRHSQTRNRAGTRPLTKEQTKRLDHVDNFKTDAKGTKTPATGGAKRRPGSPLTNTKTPPKTKVRKYKNKGNKANKVTK